jgi:competence protein ComEA
MEWQALWQKLDRKHKIIYVSILIGGITAVILLVSAPKNTLEQAPQISQHSLNATVQPAAKLIYAEATGQVKSPGVYELNSPVLLIKLIQLAGGYTDQADLMYVNKQLPLAQFVKDGQKVYIPARGENLSSATAASDQSISLNSASKDQLMQLPGVGDAMADRIIAARPYSELTQLQNVSGIGDVTYNKIVPLVSL